MVYESLKKYITDKGNNTNMIAKAINAVINIALAEVGYLEKAQMQILMTKLQMLEVIIILNIGATFIQHIRDSLGVLVLLLGCLL